MDILIKLAQLLTNKKNYFSFQKEDSPIQASTTTQPREVYYCMQYNYSTFTIIISAPLC